MYEDLSQEELEVVLEAGLEKVAYEEGVNEYINSLEKVASVHEVDAEELHDFLEKQAEEGRLSKLKQKIKDNPGKTALIGAGLGALGTGARTKQVYGDFGNKRKMINMMKEQQGVPRKDAAKLARYGMKAGGGIMTGAGAVGGAGLGAGLSKALKNKEQDN